MASAFITFEGIDGCGKSTQLRMLASELRLRGREVIATREPGGTPLGLRIRQLLLDSGHVVLSDRYADATVAYQGAGRGFPNELVSEVVVLATGGLMPDLTLIFDLPVDESQRRQARRTSKGHKADRLDAEDAAFHTRVRDAYLRIAAAEPERVRVIDASGSVQETQAHVMRLVMPFLEESGVRSQKSE